MKEEIERNIDKIVAELQKGNDVTIKTSKNGIRILSAKIKNISA